MLLYRPLHIFINGWRTKKYGFSLFELLIVLFIITLVTVMLLPTQKDFFHKTEEQIVRDQLVQTLHFARTQAFARGIPVILCKSRDQTTCSGEWRDGYIVLAQNKVLQSVTSNTQGTLVWRGLRQDHDYLQFAPNGLMQGENGAFWYYAQGADHPSWKVIISRSGRVRVLNFR